MTQPNIAVLPSLDLQAPPSDDHKSQLDLLLEYALSNFELFHDSNKDCYAKQTVNGLVWRLGSAAFKDFVCAAFYGLHNKALRMQTLTDGIAQLSALARCKNAMRHVYCRVAKHEGKYYLDLCEANSTKAICWHADGWQIVIKPPVDFVRTDAMQPLVLPITGGTVDALWKFCNVPEHQRIFVITWIIDAWRPDTVYPGMELIGEQGSGKSTTADIIRMLVDPNACNLRSAPKTHEDVFVTAGVNHLVAYENLSHLSPAMQDTLCVLSTGGGFAKRKLYSDADEHVINVKRPWLINGISACVTQQDLVDRVISIECPVIEIRMVEREQRQQLQQQLPFILGALLDIASKAEALRPSVQMPSENRPRLLEFCILGMAITQHLYQDANQFLQVFNQDRRELVSRTLDTSPACAALIELLASELVVEGPLSTILTRLSKPEHCDSWPKTPKGLGDLLRRNAPALRQFGIHCKSLGKVGSHVQWRISKQSDEPSRASRHVVAEPNNGWHDNTTCTTSTTTNLFDETSWQPRWEKTL